MTAVYVDQRGAAEEWSGQTGKCTRWDAPTTPITSPVTSHIVPPVFTRASLTAETFNGLDLDPVPLVLQAIRKAQGKTGAKHVVFVGGSGGGSCVGLLAGQITTR